MNGMIRSIPNIYSGLVAATVAASALLLAGGGAAPASAQKKAAAPAAVPGVSRTNLAESASFVVTSTLAPKGGSKVTQVYRVEVKGNNARLDYSDPAIGAVRYVANGKGVFFYIPANNTAVKQSFKGGVEGALRVAFAQANEQLRTARKIGSAVVSGQPTDIYKDPKSGAIIYLGKKPGFRLPVKTVLANEGGTRTVTVTDIKLNVALSDARFALPSGTQIIDSQEGAPPVAGGLPGGR
jgi:Outer membrane lipoprotein-sorting protein